MAHRRDCAARNDILEILAAELGLPSACTNFFSAIKTIVIQQSPGITTEDTSSILLSGDGKLIPLSAELAPTAITSIDNTVDITYNNGTFDLSVPAPAEELDSTANTASVLMSGDGTVANPLESTLASTAIISSDSSAIIAYNVVDGTFDITIPPEIDSVANTASILMSGNGTAANALSAELASTAITSSDSSLAVTYNPSGGTFDLTVAALPPGGVVNTTNSTTVALTGDGTVATPLEASLTAGALTSNGGTVIITQNGDGTLDLEVPPEVDATNNTLSVLMSGDGTGAVPLESILASTALTSADNSVTLTYTPGTGQFDLSVPPDVDAVSTNASIIMSGDGTFGNPLSSELASTAITSTDSSVSIAYNVNGTFDLSVPPEVDSVGTTASIITTGDGTVGAPIESILANTALTSADSSVILTYTPGTGQFDLSVPPELDSVATTASIITTGDGTAGNPIESILANTALTSADSSVTLTYTAGTGQFDLSVSAVASTSFIPRTTIVGPTASIGTTPQANDITTALTTVPALSPGQTWTLLLMPGTYSGASVTIPSGVMLSAFEPNTVTIIQQLMYTDSTSNNYSAAATTINFQIPPIVDSSGKTGGTFYVQFDDCVFSGNLTINLRTLADIVEFEDCNLTGSVTYMGGTVKLNQCESSLLSDISLDASNTLDAYLEINGGVIGTVNSPIQSGNSYIQVVGAVLYDVWTILGATSELRVSGCGPVYSTNPITNYTSWLLNVDSGAQAYIEDTKLAHIIDKIDTNGNWTVTSPSISPNVAGLVNRDIYFSTTPPITGSSVTINVTLSPPLVTSPIPVAPLPTGPQPVVTVVNISAAPGFAYLSAASTNALISIISQVTVVGAPMNVAIIPPVPN